jgi:hypothetical protein
MQQRQRRPINIEKFHEFLRSIAEMTEGIFIERACLYALILETGQYAPSEIDKAIGLAKKNPAYRTAAHSQLAETWKTLDDIAKAALLDMHVEISPTRKPN